MVSQRNALQNEGSKCPQSCNEAQKESPAQITEHVFEGIEAQLVYFERVLDSCTYLCRIYLTRISTILSSLESGFKPRCFAMSPELWYESPNTAQYPLGTNDVIEVNVQGANWYLPNTPEGRADAEVLEKLHSKYAHLYTKTYNVSRILSRLRFKTGLRKRSKIKPRGKVFKRKKGWVTQ